MLNVGPAAGHGEERAEGDGGGDPAWVARKRSRIFTHRARGGRLEWPGLTENWVPHGEGPQLDRPHQPRRWRIGPGRSERRPVHRPCPHDCPDHRRASGTTPGGTGSFPAPGGCGVTIPIRGVPVRSLDPRASPPPACDVCDTCGGPVSRWNPNRVRCHACVQRIGPPDIREITYHSAPWNRPGAGPHVSGCHCATRHIERREVRLASGRIVKELWVELTCPVCHSTRMVMYPRVQPCRYEAMHVCGTCRWRSGGER